MVEQICKRSGAELSPVETVHFTLWAAKDIQATFLPDIKKLEKMLESSFPEPIRSGLEPRVAHIVLISAATNMKSGSARCSTSARSNSSAPATV